MDDWFKMNTDELKNMVSGLSCIRWLNSEHEYPWLRFKNSTEVSYAVGSDAGYVYFSWESRLLDYVWSPRTMNDDDFRKDNWYLYKCRYNDRIVSSIKDDMERARHDLFQFEELAYALRQKDCLTLHDADKLNKLRKELFYTRYESYCIYPPFTTITGLPHHLQFQALDKSHYLWYSLVGTRYVLSRRVDDAEPDSEAYNHPINLPYRYGRYKLVSDIGNLIAREEQALCYAENKAWDFLDWMVEALKEAID